jgi:60 kDa SS-A/Ro ribonucleoprotein
LVITLKLKIAGSSPVQSINTGWLTEVKTPKSQHIRFNFIPNERVEPMSKALKNVNVHKPVSVKEKTVATQVSNNTGGFVFEVTPQSRLERFLVLGTDGGSYYVGERDLTKQNVDFVRQMIESDSDFVISKTVEISAAGRAKSNSPALFILALAKNTNGVDKSKVTDAVQKVARTSTHLFEYAQYLENLGGWGRAKRNSIAAWYQAKSDKALAMQVVKYRQRNGWTHRDLFRLAHPKGVNKDIGNFVLGKQSESDYPLIEGFKKVQSAKTVNEAIDAIVSYGLPWESVPTEFHKDLKLWRALFEADLLGQTALLRNVTRLAKLGAFNDLKFSADYAKRLADASRIEKGLIHPISYLNASVVYSEGQVDRRNSGYYISRNKNWDVNSKISAALDAGFYSAFKNVEPANKRTLLGVDVSGSMTWSAAAGADLSAAQVAGAMAMFQARLEPYSMVRGFSDSFKDLGISESDSLPTVMRKVQLANFGSTNISLPMQWAMKNKVEIDTFVVITDNEVNRGGHPFQALKEYRKATGIDARLAVMAVTATNFTIASPDDRGMMDFVGFDSAAPKALADFSSGRI